jgi:hypothetical protein
MLKTKENISILMGIIFGDGCVAKPSHASLSGRLSITHCLKQKEYLEWKANLIRNIFQSNINVRQIVNNGYPAVVLEKGHKYFRVLHRYLYKNKVKTIPIKALNRLTPIGLAIWWMDDGSLYPKKRNGKIHAWELVLSTYLSKEENETIVKYFQDKWDITWKITKHKNLYRLRMSTKEGRRFLEIVRPYVNQIECMKYKAINI